MKCLKLSGLIFGLAFMQPTIAKPEFHIDGFLTAAGGVIDAAPVFYSAINSTATTLSAAAGHGPVYTSPAPTRPEIDNYNSKPEFQQDSGVAIQGTLDFNKQFGMTVQLSAQGDNEWQANAEWAFLSYRMNDNWRFRAGRLRLPQFVISETLEVGYTYPWVRPPLEVYAMVPGTNYSGVDVTYRHTLFNQDLEVGFNYGSMAAPFLSPIGAAFNTPGQVFRERQIIGGTMNFGNEQIKLHGRYHENNFSLIQAGSVTQLARTYGALYDQDAFSDADITSVKIFFGSAALTVDYKNIFFMGEWVKRGTNSPGIPTQEGYYTTLGYRFCDDILPHITFAHLETTDKSRRVYSGTFGRFMNPITSLFNQDQETISLGVRYDIMPGVDIKVQVDDVKALHGTSGLFNVKPSEAVLWYSAAVDVVF